ncbi:MAG: hypothetical protein QNJ65_12285 [Xenococcaceae cyanobacterium MO_234.B1]|nr:hypothetical protein [Xenococcaceae cyanobacterium MO_234.B1]
MAREIKSSRYYVEMKTLKYGWTAPKDSYKGLENELGVKEVKDGDKGITYGGNVKPPRVRINLADGKTLVRFCDPDKVEDLVVNDTLTGKKYNNIVICSVRNVGARG